MGEEFACRCLRQDGYEILARNFRSSHSEIDIIARKDYVIAFVEVKMRCRTALSAPMSAVSAAQRRALCLPPFHI
jgi:putative endonuclease